jgi:hypothetical protein
VSDRDDLEYESRLHKVGPGRYRVGASPIYVVRHGEGDWGVYAQELHGDVRIPGAWAFTTRRKARERAFAFARQSGWA